jgi:hypothetical protein
MALTAVNRLAVLISTKGGLTRPHLDTTALAGLILVKPLGIVSAGSCLAVLATLALLHLTRLTFPPALGLALLPFVIPQPQLSYPQFITDDSAMDCLSM